ncbi:hypothetical protein P280DRAFT_461088 [Massarina eburnea CBS 473.64]|uniref:Rhodopsin domain-containing protein n=1 Tax=Massarina eburnea CBS 473.64 TaxID=1395130 RepID=A0A6A6RKS4_9PLEO|nr:hypothetical protein P280DRAFT_461088 [Massarina eburnea CBS 473.64]
MDTPSPAIGDHLLVPSATSPTTPSTSPSALNAPPQDTEPRSTIWIDSSNIVTLALIALVTIFYVLRTYTRAYLKRVWIVEDVLVTMAWIGTVLYLVFIRVAMLMNDNRHIWDLTLDETMKAAHWPYILAIEYSVTICVIKCAILCLYRRIFSPFRWSKFDLAIVALIVMMCLFYAAMTFLVIFACYPRQEVWSIVIVQGKCLNANKVVNFSGGFNALTDFMVLLLPVRAVINLQVDRKTKIRVVLAFTFGTCAPIFAMLGFFVRVVRTNTPDPLWAQYQINVWAASEVASGFLCVCFPEITFLIRHIKNKVAASRRRTDSERQIPLVSMEGSQSMPRHDTPTGAKTPSVTVT